MVTKELAEQATLARENWIGLEEFHEVTFVGWIFQLMPLAVLR
jgi:hypothetical protein